MSLYIAARRTRMGIKLSAILLILIITVKLTWSVSQFAINLLFPPDVPPPAIAYGKVLALDIPSLPLSEGSSPNYRLDTTTSSLPNIPDRLPVYKLEDSPPGLTLEKSAVDFASILGFTSQRIEVSDTDWQWIESAKSQKLNLNILSRNFELTTDLDKLAPTTSFGSSPTLQEAEGRAKSFLEQNDLFNREALKTAEVTARYVQVSGNSLKVVENQPEAQAVVVNISQTIPKDNADYPKIKLGSDFQDNFSVVTNSPNRGEITMVVANSSNPFYNLSQIRFARAKLELELKSTYPIIPITTAWNDLKEGKAKITQLRLINDNPLGSYTPLGLGNVDIRNITLGYYSTLQSGQNHLTPVYIFEGEASIVGSVRETFKARFTAIVPALDPRCTTEIRTEVGKPCDFVPNN